MPPEPLPWDRKDFFKERKHERSSDSIVSVSRWRETPRHGLSSSSSRDFGRWGSAEFRNRSSGHGKQGGWHLYSEEYGRSFTPSRSNEKILDDEGCRPSGSCADGKYSRNGRENKGSSSQKDWKGHSWENGASTNSQPHSEFVNTWDQLHSKDQHDKTGCVNGSVTGQRCERENSLGSIDWKPLKWNRSGSLSSRGSGFSHSSSSKSLGMDSSELKAELQVRVVTPVQSPSGDAVACATSVAPSEEASSRKKPRLGWGEGLAKYEKKKVDGPDDGGSKRGTGFSGSIEPMHSRVSNLADKSPRVVGLSDCTSPATPSSVACSSSPAGVEDKPFSKAANIDNNTINLSGSLNVLSPNQLEGRAFNLENLELNQIANLSSSLSELLQYDDPGSVDSSFVRSAGMNKLLVWKVNILRALEMTESEIDSLEIELKSLILESRNSCPCPAASSSLHGEYQAKPCEELVAASNLIPRPAPLQVVSSGDMIVEEVVGCLEEEHDQVRDEDVDSPGTVTSKFVELISLAKGAALSDPVNHDECAGNLNASKSRNVEMNSSVSDSDDEKTGALSASEGGDRLKESNICASPCVSTHINYDREGIFYDLILASNKDSANRASDVFNNLLPSGQCYGDISRASSTPSWRSDPLIKEKFAMRKRFLKFKERVIALKFRAFQHLWKEDIRLLSIRKVRAKSQKRLELILRTPQGTYQKHRSSIRSRFASPAGNLSLVPTMEIINFTGKLLSDSQVKLYRNSLKMPALILDKKEKIISRFISSNGLVEDPCVVEKERAVINPWTSEEKEIFMDKLTTLGKDFRKIASFLDHKTTADCIEFYYKNHKSDCFVKTKKPEVSRQGKSCLNNNYLVTAGKRWNRQINAASLDMLGAASAMAANAGDDGMENQQKCKARFILGVTGDYRALRGDDGILEKSGSLDFSDNERETVAADVLAGICGSLSSEAMSSCITSSFDRGESYQDCKYQKVGLSTRQPLTPEVTQTIDDDTCSDESSEEMDPTDWTDEEKSIFIQAVSSFGKDFAMISRCVRTRSRDQCKVFFSKSQKCLGLDMIGPRPCNEEKPLSDDVNGGGSDNEDACVVETGSVICSERSGSKIDEDTILSDLNTNHCEYDLAETVNLQTDLNRSEENNGTGQIDRKDPELLPEHLVTDDLQEECKLELDLGEDSKVENGDYSNVEGSGGTGEGTSLGESVSAEDPDDHGLSVSSAEGATVAIDQDSIDHPITEPEGQQLASENNLSEQQDKNRDANTSGATDLNYSDQGFRASGNASDLAGGANARVEFGVNPKQDQKISLDLNPPEEPLFISLEQDVSIVNANSVTKGSPASQSVKTPEQDLPSNLDIGKTSDKECQKPSCVDDYDQHRSGHSMLGYVESCQILRGYPLLMLTNKEMDGDISSEKLDSVQSLSKVDRNFHSDVSLLQESFLQKCNNSKAQSSVSELPFLSQERKSNHHSRPHSWSSSDTGKSCRNGDVKLFGQILTHPSSQQKQITSDIHENEDNGVWHPKLSSKNLNQKLTSTNVDTNSVPAKFDRNSYPGLENVPIRSYGFWDGNRIQTGFSALPDSAILLAKYPAAFGNYSTSSSSTGQQPLHSVVKSNERNLNGISVLTARDASSGNGVSEYHLFRNREGSARVQPFTVDVKQQRQDMLFPEMHRRNGFEPVSGIQPQSRGMVGINVVGRGGILVGGACTAGVSDPVAAIKMHYAKTEQYNGQTASLIREEESWRGKGDIGR